ncbi:hypothetical protein [Gemmatimonas sp.]|uniref:hypothetical protein n=1 Tax=Gemmatimonas sp. TaxID=1962908 RepID=UPI0035631035
MSGLLVTMRAQRFTRGKSHEIFFALQPVNRAREIGLAIDALAIGRLPNPAAKWGNAQRRNKKSANHRQQGDEKSALEHDGVHIITE